MKIGVFPIFYFPPISYFRLITQYSLVFLEGEDNYQKQTYRNRCKILGANGPLTLSIPISRDGIRKGKSKKSSNKKWKSHHWKSLVSAYKSSPYFEYYEDDLHSVFFTKYSSLYHRNLELTLFLLKKIGIKTKILQTSKYIESYGNYFIDHRNDFNAKDPPIELSPYIQVFSDRFAFFSDLSILDTLFCIGTNTLSYLRLNSA